MDFTFDERTEDLRKQLLAFPGEHVRSAKPVLEEQAAGLEAQGGGWTRLPVIDELKGTARSFGLWNLFLADHSQGAGLTNLRDAPLAGGPDEVHKGSLAWRDLRKYART
jgi:acyl-CoA dehydrogenase